MEIILKALELVPSTLIRIVDQVKPERYTDKLSPDRFNLREMVAHVADIEDTFLDYLRVAHDKPGATVDPYHLDEHAEVHHFSDKDIYHELEVFQNRRRDTIDYLRELKPEDWEKTFVSPQFGELSIRTLANFIVAHDVYHIEQASEYMR
jgi:uncharacterized damage-inducible protein DinB